MLLSIRASVHPDCSMHLQAKHFRASEQPLAALKPCQAGLLAIHAAPIGRESLAPQSTVLLGSQRCESLTASMQLCLQAHAAMQATTVDFSPPARVTMQQSMILTLWLTCSQCIHCRSLSGIGLSGQLPPSLINLTALQIL